MHKWLFAAVMLSTCAGHAAPPPPPPAFVPRPLHGPAAEIHIPDSLSLPAVPSFVAPAVDHGVHDPFELLVDLASLLDQNVEVRGYVRWIYNCVTANRRRGESPAQTQRRIDSDPTQCERPKLYLAPRKTTPLDHSLWVVDVPRPPNKLEKERLPKAELEAWPRVPKIAIGDYVVVSGKLTLVSPHGERNSDGLVVFSAIERAKPPTDPPAVIPTARIALLELPPLAKPRTAAPVTAAAFGDSVRRANIGSRAYGQRQYAEAIAAYTQATQIWADNHLAWYGLAGARANTGDWEGARDAIVIAAAIAPGEPMYQLFLGRFEYELAIQTDHLANRADAITPLRQAIKLEPRLWRAHYLLGRIYRDTGFAADAADELDQAVRSAPPDPHPWVVLIELYRLWQYDVQALQLAQQATSTLSESADLWYELGMAQSAVHKPALAIDAFSKALDKDPAYAKANFQRGQIYFAARDFARAKADLEAFVASDNPSAFVVQQAQSMLGTIAEHRP